MPSARIVLAGTEFSAVRDFLFEALPDIDFAQVDVATLRTKGHVADALLPAMSRIDGELMDRIQGLRLIQQWGAGLEGVDIAAATQRKIAVATCRRGAPGTPSRSPSGASWPRLR
jgi:phosphoglycerate dehydrogenase-like enzyme